MEKKRIHFNAVDLIIVIAVLAIVAALVVRQFSVSPDDLKLGNDGSAVKIEIELKVSNIQEESQNFISIGDVVKDSEGENFARITKVNFIPAESYYVTEIGEIKKLNVPGRIDAYITIECVGTINDTEMCFANKEPINISQQVNLNLPKLSVYGTILSADYEKVDTETYKAFSDELAQAASVFSPFNAEEAKVTA